jgi:hypothetical protein
MRIDHGGTGDPLARFARMMEHYRLAKIRRLERRAITLWRKLEAQQAFIELEKPLERVH